MGLLVVAVVAISCSAVLLHPDHYFVQYEYFHISCLWVVHTYIHLYIHFIETRLQNTIGIIMEIQMAWLTGWRVIW